MTEEKIYDIPLRKFYTESGRRKKAPHAVKGVRDFIAKKMRSENVFLASSVNELLWSRGVSHPPAKIRVKVTKDGDKVVANLISAAPATKPKKEETSKDVAEIKKEVEEAEKEGPGANPAEQKKA